MPQALAKLREDDRLRSIPVIALSAEAVSHDIEYALEEGLSNFVTKPIEIGKLLAAIDEVLGEGREARGFVRGCAPGFF